MPPKHSSVADAYAVLGLEQGSSLENVKTTYKQLALRTHPDKNPGNEDATAQFQRLSEAYNVLLKHLDSRGPSSYHHSYGYDDDSGNYSDDDYDDGYESEEDLQFYMFMFEELLKGRSGRYKYSRSSGNPHASYRRQPSLETDEQYEARIRRNHEEQLVAQERRAKEDAERKLRLEKEREKEREEAEERQKAKASEKRVKAETERKDAQKAIRTQLQRAQTLRSSVFAAARSGDAEKVKKGVWEDEVDAAGGEIKIGCDDFVKSAPRDCKETLSHIAARMGDIDLVLWLDSHSAEPEERNSGGYTAFHIALQHGLVPIVQHYFESYPPKETEYKPIYNLPESNSLLSLALDSREPEVVWMILHKNLASTQNIANAWARVSSGGGGKESKKASGRKTTNAKDAEKAEDIRKLLMTFGGFTPPSTPKIDPEEQNSTPSGEHRGRNRERETLEQKSRPPRTPLEQLSFQSPRSDLKQQQKPSQSRGRGHGGGRGRGRGGRGRGTVV